MTSIWRHICKRL